MTRQGGGLVEYFDLHIAEVEAIVWLILLLGRSEGLGVGVEGQAFLVGRWFPRGVNSL